MTTNRPRGTSANHRRPGLSTQTLRSATTAALYAHLTRLTADDNPDRSREAQRIRDELNRRYLDYLDSITSPIAVPGASPLDPESIRFAATLDTGGPMGTEPRTPRPSQGYPGRADAQPLESNAETANRDRSSTHVTEHDRTS